MQRELRAAKDLASSSAAQAAGTQAYQQDVEQLQVNPHVQAVSNVGLFKKLRHYTCAQPVLDTDSCA